MFELPSAPHDLRRSILLCLWGLLVCVTVALSACSDDRDSQQTSMRADTGVDAPSDAPVDASSGADVEIGAASDSGTDTSRPRDTDDDANDAGSDSSDARDSDAGTQSCTDGDQVCPGGCYATTDDDCVLDCRDPSTWPPSWVAFEEEAIRVANQRRAQGANCGDEYFPPADPMTFNAQLREAARCHSLDMARNDVYGHEGSDGSTAGERLDATGYDWRTRNEIVAAKRFTAAEVVGDWMDSPGHCKAIADSKYHDIGMGYVYEDPDALGYNAYWTGVVATSW